MTPLKIPCHPDKLDPSCHLCRVIMFDKRYQERFGVTEDMLPKGMPCGHNPQFSGCQVCTEVLNSEKHRARFGLPRIGKEEYKEEAEEMMSGLPCGHKEINENCYFCKHWQGSNGHIITKPIQRQQAHEPQPQGKVDKKALSVVRERCVHYTGKKLKESPSCGCGPLMECTKHGQCRTFNPGPEGVVTCLNCPDRKIRPEVYPNPKAGVVLGTFGYPNLVAFQVHLIRKHNPNIPILLVDDNSDGTTMTPVDDTNFGKLCKLSREYNDVTVWSNPTRLGHASGELSCYFVGFQWAKAKDLDALVKLSFRYIMDIPNWVEMWLNDFWPSGVATSTQKCREGGSFFEVRSECIMFDVHKWHRADILDHIRPRPLSVVEGKWGVALESILWDDIRDRLDGTIHKCKFFGEDRFVRHPNQLWHCNTPKEEYEAIMKREGFELDPNFTCVGWVHQPGYKG